MDIKDKITILCAERDQLRNEIILFQQNMFKIVFFFFIISISFIGIDSNIFNINLANIDKEILLFILLQIEFFLGIFLIALMTNQNVHAGYIRGIEKKINSLSKNENLSFWESSITKKYLGSIKGITFWILTLFFLIIYCSYIISIIIFFKKISKVYYTIFLIIIIFELVIGFLLLILGILETRRVEKETIHLFEINNKNQKKKKKDKKK